MVFISCKNIITNQLMIICIVISMIIIAAKAEEEGNVTRLPSSLMNEAILTTTSLEHTENIVQQTTQIPSSPQATSSISSSTTQAESITAHHTTSTVPTSPYDNTNNNCPPLVPGITLDSLTNEQFTSQLTDACRYDRLVKPATTKPLDVFVQVDLRHIESADQLQFLAHMLVQYRYMDHRLRYDRISPSRGPIVGEELLRNKIWVPHTIVRNEKDTAIMGIDGKDIFVSISPQGDVIYLYRMTANFYCWMNLQKFPFDSQYCNLQWSSWTYNTSNLVLHWERETPVQLASNLHLTEFIIGGTWTEETEVTASFSKGAFIGNYSELVFKFKLLREVGYYIMDYFLPSILLVCMSWVTFWLQADAAPPRVTLGTSIMLAFITLNGGVTKNLPKVSYIKASEIWFLGCACFIFCSLAEFAFVNVIWRRRKKVEIKKQSSKHILKGAITPSLARRQLRKASINNLYKAHSCSSLDSAGSSCINNKLAQSNYLTVHSFPNSSSCTLNVPTIITQMSQDDLITPEDQSPRGSTTTISIPCGVQTLQDSSNDESLVTWETMTPQEVAIWIDNKSRILFPLLFLIFNVFYWTFVYLL